MKKIFFLLAIVCFSKQLMAGGGWVASKKSGYFKLGQSFLYSNAFFNKAGERANITTAGVYITSLYGEYGIGNNLEVSAYLPVFFRSTINQLEFLSGSPSIPGDEFNYFGDPEIGLKYALVKTGPVVIAAGLKFGIPLGRVDGGASESIATGDGEFNQQIRLDFGTSFAGGKAFAAWGVGVNNRTNNFSEEFRYNAEIGYFFTPKLFAIAKIDGIESFKNGSENAAGGGIFSNNLELLIASFEVAYQTNSGWGVTGKVLQPLSGENIISGRVFEAGIFFKLN